MKQADMSHRHLISFSATPRLEVAATPNSMQLDVAFLSNLSDRDALDLKGFCMVFFVTG
jgi:hypothetical protein